jgi:hypothetical protein
VTDASSRTATATQVLTVSDARVPVISWTLAGQASRSAAANPSCQALVPNFATNVTKSDNCTAGASLVVTQDPAAGTLETGSGAHSVVVTVADAAGNTSTLTGTITIVDSTLPTITPGSNQSVSMDAGLCYATVALSNPTVADNCPSVGAPVAISGLAGNNHYSVGVTSVVWQVTDAAGNTRQASQTVTVAADAQNPTITDPSAVTDNAGVACTATPSLGSPTTGDNCSVASTTNNAPGAFPLGPTTVTWTVTTTLRATRRRPRSS